MLKSGSVDMDDSLRLSSEIRKPKLFRRSVTVPRDILCDSSSDEQEHTNKFLDLVNITLLFY